MRYNQVLNKHNDKGRFVNNHHIEIQEQTEEDKIYSLPEPKKSQELFISLLIKELNRVIQNWDNIEIILSNLGIDDPNDFIITAKTTFTITDTNKRFEIECDLVDRLLSVPKSNLALDFLFYADSLAYFCASLI